jgi:triphosphoribosyl-dephospho-CoA synthase
MTGEEVAGAAQLACLLEVSAPKPGNVSPGRHFHDTSYEDFLASAVAIGPALAAAGDRPLGATIRSAIEATNRWAGRNTNLGIVLLLAPLARAACRSGGTLRARVEQVLAETTVADAADVYDAIRLARPGGLGTASTEDVSGAPTVTLTEAMGLAADRDSVAREYVTGFAATFEIGAPAVRDARGRRLRWPDAAMYAFLALLAAVPDTLIARKLGRAEAERVSRRAAEVRRGGPRELAAFDAELRDARNTRNPGTTADLTCASLFAVILEDGWNR